MISSTTSSLIYSSLEEFISELKEIFNKLRSNNYKELNLKIIRFKNSSDNFVKSLENQNEFAEEFYLYLNIRDMIYYLFDNRNLLIDNISFLNSIFTKFFHLMNLKLGNNRDYDSYLEEFKSFLIEQERYFFSNVYTPSKFHDRNALNEMTSLLMR